MSGSRIPIRRRDLKFLLGGVEPSSPEGTLLRSIGCRYLTSSQEFVVPAIHYICNEISQELGISFPPLEIDLVGTWHPRFADLKPYQKTDIITLAQSPLGGGLLAHSPGLGKTVSAIVGAGLVSAKAVLVVCPASLKFNWESEIRQWDDPSSERSWTVVSYQALQRSVDQDLETPYLRPWDLVIFDESILLVNGRNSKNSTKRFKAACRVRAYAKRAWLLSGSPVANYLDDLWAQFHLIAPWAFTSYWRFAERFCIVEQSVWGSSVVGSRRIDLKNEFPDLLISRNQRDVVDLPEILFETINVEWEPSLHRRFKKLRDGFILELSSGAEIPITTKVHQLIEMQKLVSEAKHPIIEEMIDARSFDLPCIIWTHWLENSQRLADRLWKKFPQLRIERVVGGDSDPGGQVRKFQAGETDVLILSIEAMKFGHTLTTAKTVIYLDRTWRGDAYYQSLLRVKRIGLSHTPLALTLKIPFSTDGFIDLALQGKMVSIASVSNHDLAELLGGLK